MGCLVASLTSDNQRICMARLQKGLTVRALAAEAGVSGALISRLERGCVQHVRPLSAQKICSALDIPFESHFVIQEIQDTDEIKGDVAQ